MDFLNFSSLYDILIPNIQEKSLGGIISSLLPYIFSLVGFLLFILLVIGGYEILVSQGDSKSLERGKNRLTFAIIGFLIFFSAYFIVQIVARILGIGQIENIFQP